MGGSENAVNMKEQNIQHSEWPQKIMSGIHKAYQKLPEETAHGNGKGAHVPARELLLLQKNKKA